MAEKGKKVKASIKLVIKAGAANPAPPVGAVLGPLGINLVQFCKEFNDQTATATGMIPVLVDVYEDRSYSFVIKTPAVSELLKQTLNIPKGTDNPLKNKVATITLDQVKEIAEKKQPDLNSYDVKNAMLQVMGTCRSMGVKVDGDFEEYTTKLQQTQTA